MGYTKKLAQYAVDMKYDDLPNEVIHQAKLLTLHTLGVGLAACQTSHGQRAIALAKDMSGEKDEATVLGDGSRIGCTQAGFANGTLVDILDWEDCSWTGHPSAGAIPAALAVGERVKASGKDFITSIVAGYEVYERIAMAVQPTEEWALTKGWGLTSWAVYSSAITAAKLLDLDLVQMEHAIGIAGALTHIINSKVHLNRTDFYHYKWGMNCKSGIEAALIANSGISPLADFLDGEKGYWSTLSDKCDWEWFDKDLGKEYLIMETYFKHWPSNMWIQQHLDGLHKIIEKHQVAPGDVEHILVTPPVQARMDFNPEGYASMMAAQFSIPYCLSILMHEPEPGPNWYTEEKRKDPEILELAGRVKAEGQTQKLYEAFLKWREGGYPNMSVEVTTKDGRILREEVPHPKGHPLNRMTDDEFKDRFRRTASFVLKDNKIETAIDKMMNLEDVKDVSELGNLVHD